LVQYPQSRPKTDSHRSGRLGTRGALLAGCICS